MISFDYMTKSRTIINPLITDLDVHRWPETRLKFVKECSDAIWDKTYPRSGRRKWSTSLYSSRRRTKKTIDYKFYLQATQTVRRKYGYSLTSYFRWIKLLEETPLPPLVTHSYSEYRARNEERKRRLSIKSKRKPNPKNRVPRPVEAAVIDYGKTFPDHGQQRASDDLKKSGVEVSPSGVRSIWSRNCMETKEKRRALTS